MTEIHDLRSIAAHELRAIPDGMALGPVEKPTDTGTILSRPPVDLEIVIPSYNEEQRLPETVRRTVSYLEGRPWRSAVVVVDNDSVDHTAAVSAASEHVPVTVIGCAERGKGAAVRRGLYTSQSTVVGYMDADLATPVETLDEVMQRLDAGADIVTGTRYGPDARFELAREPLRRLGGSAFRALVRSVLPDITDTQCGFTFFRGEVARELADAAKITGFAFDVELLLQADRHGRRIEEIPVHWTPKDGSRFKVWPDGLKSFLDVIGLLVRYGPATASR